MAKIDITISSLVNENGKSELLLRVNVNRNVRLRVKSGIYVYPNRFKNGAIALPRAEDGKGTRKEMLEASNTLSNLTISIINFCEAHTDLSKDDLTVFIDKFHNPQKYAKVDEKQEPLCEMFQRYVNGWSDTGIIGAGRKKHYDVVIRELTRFFIINGMDGCSVKDFNKDIILKFREFLRTEYKLVDKYPALYLDMNNRNKPSKERSQNTIAEKLLLLQAFMVELESNDIIPVSPFRKIGKEKEAIMKQQYDEPIFLTKAEFNTLLEKECPESLQRVKDLFIVQCCLGCRVGDFRRFTFDNIGIEEGIPYIHYLPQKTHRDGLIRTEVKTPIISIAYDIIMKYKGELPNNALLPYYPDGNGETGYNYQIKKLLEFYEINRKVAIFNTTLGINEYQFVYEVASSKLARKTHVDLMNKVQIDKYAAGLHKRGSSAVDRYTQLGLKEKYILMCAAFGCEPALW
ncbi:phage integrase SAM-like domain-containing protein [uncultured Bacteroides sp.]|uniref:phage integrase SAM-like domain-containing protein n=1 Tax=uncultured Bacteroides sp. TaxID=162156 RepID=UPI00280A56E7|nr:phage integrase SAM-like domain-containing protein [uncultured Bacteroides sp.]